jgi:hypothetical protein
MMARSVRVSWSVRTAVVATIATLLTLLGAASAEGQRPRSSVDRNGATRMATVDDTARPRDPGDDREVRGVVVAGASPRTFRVVTVSLPPELAGAGAVTYEVVGTGAVSLLGAPTGTIARGGAVVLTVGVPATAGAGRTRAGFVRFAAPGLQAVRAPIEVEVSRVSHIDVTATQPMRGARPGDRVEVAFTILNAGNLQDTLDLEIDAPATWNAHLTASSRVVLQRGESVERTVAATIPLAADLGDVALTLIARSRAGDRALASSIIEVTDPLRGGRRPGPVVTVGAASAISAGVATRSVESMAIDGPVTDEVSVSGRFSTPMTNDLVGSRALSTLGYNSQANFLSVAAPNWGATIGTTGLTLDDLGGQNVFGRGASLRLGLPDQRLQLMSAAPFPTDGPWAAPTLYSATGQKQIGAGLVGAFVSHLRDSTYLVRSLDAFGLSLDAQPWHDAHASGAIAERAYRDGNGIGAQADFRGPLAGGDVALRVTHAPGGAMAFAPARDFVSMSADRAFGRMLTSFGYWSTQDNNAAQTNVGSTGWSLSPTYPVLSTLTVGLDVMHSSVTSRDSLSGFGSTQRDYGLRARLVHGGFEIGGDTRWSSVSQNVADSAVTLQEDAAQRLTNRLRLDHVGSRGAIGVGGSIETAILGGVNSPPQSTFDAHIDRFQLWPRFPRWTVSASAQRLRFGDVAVTTSRAELDVSVHNSIRVVLGAERGTARDAFGLLHTIVTLKVERSSSMSAFDRRVETGIVFQDRNGNGLRDPGEGGVAGIVVHRGTETAVTDANGEYRMNSGSTARAEVDDRSLPQGWLQSPRLLDRVSDPLELGVIPSTSLDVRIELAPATDGSLPAVRLGTATFALRDSTGREWIARADASLRATFDALPAGRYSLTTQLDGSSEPLVVDPTPSIDIGATPGRQRVVVTVRTRPVRIFKSKQQIEGRDRGAP